MKAKQRIAVVGLGAMGSAALAHLAKNDGVEAIGLDPFEPGHTNGSSHGYSRVVRQAYFEHPDYVPLLKRAFDLWEELERETRTNILFRTGVLIAGGPDSVAISASRASAVEHGIAVRDLDCSELAVAYPQFRLPPDYVGLLEPGGGFVIPEYGIAAHHYVAKDRGAEVRLGVSVERVRQDGDGVLLDTSEGPVRADAAVVCAGAWTDRIVPAAQGLGLSPQRKLLVWFDPKDPGACATPAMPTWLIDDAGNSGEGVYYGVPTWPGQPGPPGVKVGFHGPGVPIEPGAAGEPNPARIEKFMADMARLVPVLGAPTASINCTYTMSPDEHFVVDTIEPNVVIACGFSGHGYKFAPVIGEVLAQLAVGRSPALDIGFLSAARFTPG